MGNQAHPGHQVFMGHARKADDMRRLDLDERFGIAAQLDSHHRLCGIIAENLPLFTKLVEGGIGFHRKHNLPPPPGGTMRS